MEIVAFFLLLLFLVAGGHSTFICLWGAEGRIQGLTHAGECSAIKPRLGPIFAFFVWGLGKLEPIFSVRPSRLRLAASQVLKSHAWPPPRTAGLCEMMYCFNGAQLNRAQPEPSPPLPPPLCSGRAQGTGLLFCLAGGFFGVTCPGE